MVLPLISLKKLGLFVSYTVFVLKLPKGITHKQFELFEFRLMEYLLEIMCYRWCNFDSRKVQ